MNSRRRSQTGWLWQMLPVLACALLCTFPALGQANPAEINAVNPLQLLDDAAGLLPGVDQESPERLSTALNIIVLLTVLSLAPAILIMCTCFTRMVVVLALLRQALGTQGVPPSQVVVGLCLFLTIVVMGPTFERMYENGIRPYAQGEITDYEVAWQETKQPLRDFMFAQLDATGNWSGVYMMLNYRGVDTSDPSSLTRADVDMMSLVPAFVLSELKVAFLMGFRVYLPFLVIDIVIASMLISMGMLMLPPVLISLPFKLLLFVLVDGWQLIGGSLMTSVVQPDVLVSGAALLMGGW